MTAPNIPRNQRIMRLREDGLTWAAIADQLVEDGYQRVSRQTVGAVIKREKAKEDPPNYERLIDPDTGKEEPIEEWFTRTANNMSGISCGAIGPDDHFMTNLGSKTCDCGEKTRLELLTQVFTGKQHNQ